MRLRWYWYVLLLGALAFGLTVAAHPWGFLYSLGVHPYPESSSTPWTYQLWSGFIPAMAIVTLFSGVTAHFRAINCHVKGCWRIGRFAVAGGHYKVCRPHHPEKHVRKERLTAEHIRTSHALHLLRQSGKLHLKENGWGPFEGPAEYRGGEGNRNDFP